MPSDGPNRAAVELRLQGQLRHGGAIIVKSCLTAKRSQRRPNHAMAVQVCLIDLLLNSLKLLRFTPML
jgi:hypothetical protein